MTQVDTISNPENISGLPSDIPLPSDAFDFQLTYLPPYNEPYNEDCSEFFFQTHLSESELGDFFVKNMQATGWEVAHIEKSIHHLHLYFQKLGQRSGVFISLKAVGPNWVVINYLNWFYTFNCKKVAEDVPIIGGLRGSFYNGFSVSYDPSGSKYSSTAISYLTTYSAKEVYDFYVSELPLKGWEVECANGGESSFYIKFVKPDRPKPSPHLIDTDRIYIMGTSPTPYEMSNSAINIYFYQDPGADTWCYDN